LKASQAPEEVQVDNYAGLNQVSLPESCEVLICHVNNINSFYGQLADPAMIEKLNEITEEIFNYCKTLDTKSYIPKVGEPCYGLYQDSWHRACCEAVTDEKATLFYIDYGNKETVLFSDVRPVSLIYHSLPALAIQMQLHNSRNLPLLDDTAQVLRGCIDQKRCSIQVINKSGTPEVDIVDIKTQTNARDYLESLFLYTVEEIRKSTQQDNEDCNKSPANQLKSPLKVKDQNENLLSTSGHSFLPEVRSVPIPPSPERCLKADDNSSNAVQNLIKQEPVESTEYEPSQCVTEALVPTVVKAEVIEAAPIQNLMSVKVEPPNSPAPNNSGPIENTFSKSKMGHRFNPYSHVAKTITHTALPKDGWEEIYPCNVLNPYCIYAQFQHREEFCKLKKVVDNLNRRLSKVITKSCHVQAGTYYAALNENKWYRVLAINVPDENDEPNSPYVYYIDYGYCGYVPVKNFRSLSKEDKVLPAQCVLLALRGIKPLEGQEKFSVECIKLLRRTLKDNLFVVNPVSVDSASKKLTVNMVTKVSRKSAGSFLADAKVALVEHFNEQQRKPKTQLPMPTHIPFDEVSKKIPMRTRPQSPQFEVIITCVTNPRLFFGQIHDPASIEEVDNIGTYLHDKYEDTFNPSMQKGKPCPFNLHDLVAVRYRDNLWYRGFILKIFDDSTVDVWLIDYGINDNLPQWSILPLPVECTKLPSQALTMQMFAIQPVNQMHFHTEAIKHFKSLILGKLMKAELHRVIGPVLRVNLWEYASHKDVTDSMVEAGFAQRVIRQPVLPSKPVNPRENPQLALHQAIRRSKQAKQNEGAISNGVASLSSGRIGIGRGIASGSGPSQYTNQGNRGKKSYEVKRDYDCSKGPMPFRDFRLQNAENGAASSSSKDEDTNSLVDEVADEFVQVGYCETVDTNTASGSTEIVQSTNPDTESCGNSGVLEDALLVDVS